jgi:SAM-dependent methyltransferase
VSGQGLFDRHAAAYNETVQAAITASGESPGYFADLKVKLVVERLGGARPKTALDFGCGIGNTTRSLARYLPAARLTGFDQSAESIAVASALTAKESDRVQYRAGSGNALPFADGTFDLAFTSCVFHHIERSEHVAWARELARVTARGGSLFLFEHNPLNPLTLQVVRSCPFDEGVVLLRAGYAARMLAQAGLDVREVGYYFFFPRMLGFLRPMERYLRAVPIGAQYYILGVVRP